jgi:hypothetical protein
MKLISKQTINENEKRRRERYNGDKCRTIKGIAHIDITTSIIQLSQ